ncbi:MAG: hypothetical protein JNM22_05630 [Saprospiraceae bacterium]|nr:hypothetical protein [Saprospiraceae bacterium]
MRAVLFSICMLLLCSLSAQQRYNWRHAIAPASLSLVSGGAWGLHEKTMHHWPQFQDRFPGANPKFWNPAVSWTNKYRNWPEDKTRRRVPVFFTDAKHLLASVSQVSAFSAGACITLGDKRPWWHYALDVGISFAAYSAGNYITFNALYR